MVGSKCVDPKKAPIHLDGHFIMELKYAGKFVNNGKDYEGGTIECKNDVSDGGKAVKGKGTMYDLDYFEVVDVHDDDEDDVDGYEEDDVVEASGEASLHSVPVYDDNGDESDKEIYDEENNAAVEDDNMFMHNVQIRF
ncbi:unnamed protein product [Prunus brigantina]